MLLARAVADLTLDVGQLRALVQVDEATRLARAQHVALHALAVLMFAPVHERLHGVGVLALLPDGVGCGVTGGAGLGADERRRREALQPLLG
jgi:hypothetical protein